MFIHRWSVISTLAILAILTPTVFRSAATNWLMLNAVKQSDANGAIKYEFTPEVLIAAAKPAARGYLFSRRHQLDRALSSWEEAVSSSHHNPIHAFWLGVVLIQLDHSAEAVDAWREADSSRYWAWLSATEAEKGRNSSAYEMADRAMLTDPNDEKTQFILGEVYYHLEDWQQAVKHLSAALESSHEVQAWYYDALMLRGQAYMALPGNLNKAYNDFVRASRLRPLDPWPYIRLCQVFGLEHKFDNAIAACQQATHFAKDSAFAHYYLGWAFFQDGQWTAAEAAFERSLELDPNLQAAQEWLIRTYEQE